MVAASKHRRWSEKCVPVSTRSVFSVPGRKPRSTALADDFRDDVAARLGSSKTRQPLPGLGLLPLTRRRGRPSRRNARCPGPARTASDSRLAVRSSNSAPFLDRTVEADSCGRRLMGDRRRAAHDPVEPEFWSSLLNSMA